MKKYLAGIVLLVAGGACALALVRPAFTGIPVQAQAPLTVSKSGRFQLVGLPNSNPLVIDTETGKVWRINGANNWESQGSPPQR